MRASFIYHQITAILSVVGTIITIYALIKERKNHPTLIMGLAVIALAISWGIHGIVHFLEEYMFDFEPLSGRVKVLDKPIRS